MNIQWKSIVIACTLLSIFSGLTGCKSNGTGNWYSYKNYSLYNPLKPKSATDASAVEVPVIAAISPAAQSTADANLPVIPNPPAPENAAFNSQATTQVPNVYALYPASQAPPEYQQTSFHQTNENTCFAPIVDAPAPPQPCSCRVNAYSPLQNDAPQTCPLIDTNAAAEPQQKLLPAIVGTNP